MFPGGSRMPNSTLIFCSHYTTQMQLATGTTSNLPFFQHLLLLKCNILCLELNNEWSKNFDESPHRMSCRCWRLNDHFAAYTAADSQCFSVGRTTPKFAPFCVGISTPSNTWLLGPHASQSADGVSITMHEHASAFGKFIQTSTEPLADKTHWGIYLVPFAPW